MDLKTHWRLLRGIIGLVFAIYNLVQGNYVIGACWMTAAFMLFTIMWFTEVQADYNKESNEEE